MVLLQSLTSSTCDGVPATATSHHVIAVGARPQRRP